MISEAGGRVAPHVLHTALGGLRHPGTLDECLERAKVALDNVVLCIGE